MIAFALGGNDGLYKTKPANEDDERQDTAFFFRNVGKGEKVTSIAYRRLGMMRHDMHWVASAPDGDRPSVV